VPTQTKVVTPTPTVTVVTTKKATTKNFDLYISAEYVEPYKQGWLEGYEHSVDVSNKGEEAFKGRVSLSFENEGQMYESAVGAEIPPHGSSRVYFPPIEGGCNKNPNKVGIILKTYRYLG
jgi:hypothetical protein